MEDPLEGQALEDRSVVILQKGRVLSMDLMEDHLADQILRTPLDLALDMMVDPWEDQVLKDRSMGILLTEKDLTLL